MSSDHQSCCRRPHVFLAVCCASRSEISSFLGGQLGGNEVLQCQSPAWASVFLSCRIPLQSTIMLGDLLFGVAYRVCTLYIRWYTSFLDDHMLTIGIRVLIHSPFRCATPPPVRERCRGASPHGPGPLQPRSDGNVQCH